MDVRLAASMASVADSSVPDWEHAADAAKARPMATSVSLRM